MLNAVRRTLIAAVVLIMSLPASASATWSIIVLDKRTGFIGVGAASCTSDVYGIMALVPGTGALMAQAISEPSAMREALRLLRAGFAPDSILRAITKPSFDSAIAVRQYAIATFTSGQAQFTGTSAPGYDGERSGVGVLVQGNILTGPAVLDGALEAIERARAAGKPMEEIVMAGLRAGADAGGDSRCGPQRATSAFLAVAKPRDIPNWPYLTLRVVDVDRGSRVNAVELLQRRLALWQSAGGAKYRVTSETVRPDSTP